MRGCVLPLLPVSGRLAGACVPRRAAAGAGDQGVVAVLSFYPKGLEFIFSRKEKSRFYLFIQRVWNFTSLPADSVTGETVRSDRRGTGESNVWVQDGGGGGGGGEAHVHVGGGVGGGGCGEDGHQLVGWGL